MLCSGKSSLCTSGFFSALVSVGIYNFTTNIEGVKYLAKHSNTLEDVKQFQRVQPTYNNVEPPAEVKPNLVQTTSSLSLNCKIIGVKSITSGAGSTTFIYMLKKS